MAQQASPPTEAAAPSATVSSSDFVIPPQYRDDAAFPGDLIIRAASINGGDMVNVRCHAYPLWKTAQCTYFKTILEGDWAETNQGKGITEGAPANVDAHSTIKPACDTSKTSNDSKSTDGSSQSNVSTHQDRRRTPRATISFPAFDVAIICAFLEYIEDPSGFEFTLAKAKWLLLFAQFVGHNALWKSSVNFMAKRLHDDPVGIWSAAQRARAPTLYYNAGLVIMLSWNDDLQSQIVGHGEVWRDTFIKTRMDYMSHIARAAGMAWSQGSNPQCPFCKNVLPALHQEGKTTLQQIVLNNSVSLDHLYSYWKVNWPGPPACQCQKQAMIDSQKATERLRLPTNSAKKPSK